MGKTHIPDQKLRELITHFGKYRLTNDDFEFPDLLGAAYEYLIKEFADSAGKKGGEFYTPRDVVRLMVLMLAPAEGMRVYDPCCGSGGMLILSRQYVEEHGGNPRDVSLYGQDNNGGVWAICKMNMLLHGIPDADVQNEDTLLIPAHVEGGELMRFDRVITNPPFSQNYTQEGMKFPERFRYGFCPENGKKADLMFAQHMVAVLRPGGMLATVMPHGVLFRGGAERDIRKGFIDDDLLEAVISLPPNLFYGTGIPACILVMRAKGAKPKARKGNVLFINADAEFRAGRAQNYLRPEDIEKMVSTFNRFADVPGYATLVSHEALAANDYNLNIRHYADNAPPPEPHDVHAHLLGGVPKAEVEANCGLFEAHGFNPRRFLINGDKRYFSFGARLKDRAQIKVTIEADEGVQQKETELCEAFAKWWGRQRKRLAGLPETKDLMVIRAELLKSFESAMVPVGVLDQFKVSGVIASWFSEALYDLKALAAQGFDGLVDGWIATIRAAVEEDDKASGSFDPLEHKLVRTLLPDYLQELADALAKKADLEGQIEAAKPSDEEGDDAAEADDADRPTEEQVKAIKKDLAAVRKDIKKLEAALLDRLDEVRTGLGADEIQRLVLDLFHADLAAQLDRYVGAHRQQIIEAVENWWDKYKVTLQDIEGERDGAAKRLKKYLDELGYQQ